MDLIQKANKLGYKHYTEFTVEELDNLSLGNSNKQIEYYFIQKWLREVYCLELIISSNLIGYGYIIYDRKNHKNITNINVYQKYEEALEQGIYEALKLIKNE